MVVKYKVQQTAGLLQHERVINQVAEFDVGALPIRGATSKRIAAAARIPTSAGCGIRAKNALVQIKMSVLEPVQREKMRTAQRPCHLLLLHEASADHLIDRRLYESRGDRFA